MELSFSWSAVWFHGLLLLVLLISLLAHWRAYHLSKAAVHWHPVSAQVLEVFVKTRVNDGEEEHAPYVKYSYRFKGRQFTCKRVQYGQLWSADYFLSAEMIAPIRLKQKLPVLVNPRSPNQSTIYAGYHGHIGWHVAGHLFFMSVVLYLLLQ